MRKAPPTSVRHAEPLRPLTPDEIFAVVAWIVAQNEIISPTAVIDAASLPRVRMPAGDRFVPDDWYGEQSSARRSRDR
jgi:hypothetical protein